MGDCGPKLYLIFVSIGKPPGVANVNEDLHVDSAQFED